MSNVPKDFNDPLYPKPDPKKKLEDTNLYPITFKSYNLLMDKDKVSDPVKHIPVVDIDSKGLDYNVVPTVNHLDNEPILYGKPAVKGKLDKDSVY